MQGDFHNLMASFPTSNRSRVRSEMRRVLVLAYYFPPLGGVGAQRTVKFLKHLPSLGYDAIVVTGPEAGALEWAPRDAALEGDLPASLRIVRTRNLPPLPRRAQGRIRRVLARPTAFERWWRAEAVSAAREVMDDVDLVYASMSPFGTASAAADIGHAAQVPWIADLRDPWALDEWTVYPTGFHRWLDKRRMRRALRSAAAIVMNTREAGALLVARFPELRGSRVTTITNGWDRDDFAGCECRRDDSPRIVFTGWSHVETGRRHRRQRFWRSLTGGSIRGLDPLARSHVPLVRALNRLQELDPELAARTELHLAGPAKVDIASDVGAVRITDHGYLPHDQAVALMRSADVLFLPMHGLPGGTRATTVPGKTYEYVASGSPVVAAVPDGDARDLLSGLPNVWLCRPGDIECIAVAFRDALRAGPRGRTASTDILERFERHRLAGDLAAVFDDVLESSATR